MFRLNVDESKKCGVLKIVAHTKYNFVFFFFFFDKISNNFNN